MYVGSFGSGGSRLMVYAGPEETSPGAPLVLAGEAGYTDLDLELRDWKHELASCVVQLGAAMRASNNGLWLAFVDVPGERRLALVQSNRGPFTEAHHGPGYAGQGRVWHDFYCRAGYYLLDEIERRWAPSAVQASHPTGHGWPPDLAPSFLDGVRRWILNSGDVALAEIHFRLELPAVIGDALKQLESEDRDWHEVSTELHPPSVLGAEPELDAHAELLRVDVLSRPSGAE